MSAFPDWVKPGASFRRGTGSAEGDPGREFHVRAFVDGLVILREWSVSERAWRYTAEPPGHFEVHGTAITDIIPAVADDAGILGFERGVLARPEAHTYGAVRMAGEAVFSKLDDLLSLRSATADSVPEENGRKWPRNPFRKDILKRQFAACIYCYFSRDKDFFRGDGSRNTGNGVANQFWWGFDGARKPHQWDAASKDTPAYASYRAGELVAAFEKSIIVGHEAGKVA